MAQVEYTSAQSGTGKTYSRCSRYWVDDFFPNRAGKVYTNFPVHLEIMIDYVSKKYPNNKNCTPEKLRERICIIPREEVEKWRNFKLPGQKEYTNYTPFDYLYATIPGSVTADRPDGLPQCDLEGAIIQIDEVHNYIDTTARNELKDKWKKGIGELRHAGVICCEFISQYDTKVATLIRHESSICRTLVNISIMRDPYFGILYDDWYNLRAGLFETKYSATVFEITETKVKKKWKELEGSRVVFQFIPEYFTLYDSYSKPQAGGHKATGAQHVYLNLSKRELTAWFLRRNFFKIAKRLVLLVFFVWFMCGGYKTVIDGFTKYMPALIKSSAVASPAVGSPAPGLSATGAPGAVTPVVDRETFTRAEMAILVDDRERLMKLIEEAEPKLKKLETLEKQELEGSAPAMIAGRLVTFRNGRTYRLGETIQGGPYDGKKIEAIDQRRLSVTIGGEVLWLARR